MRMTNIQSRQQGAALAVSLIILTLMTVIGVTAIKSSVVENRIASNMYDKQLSFEAAEAALRDAEAYLSGLDDNPNAVTSDTTEIVDGVEVSADVIDVWVKGYPTNTYEDAPAALETKNFTDKSVWDTYGEPYGAMTGADAIADVSSPPEFIIEQFTFIPDDMSAETLAAGKGQFYYRITARAHGASPTSVTTLQTIYRMRYK